MGITVGTLWRICGVAARFGHKNRVMGILVSQMPIYLSRKEQYKI